MTIVVSNRQRIFYRFEGEKGAYLLLHHGLFGSHRDWFDAGYVEALQEDFRLILMDARGHGRSDRSLDPMDFRPEAFADDITAIMDELGIHNLHVFGYGFGALVGLELLLKHPDRVRIVMMGGASPFVTEAMREDWRDLATRIRSQGLARVLAALHDDRRLPYLPRHEEGEGEQAAALVLLEALAGWEPRPENGRMSVNSPVAMFTGESDPAAGEVEDARRRIHRARFVSIPGEDHAGLFLEREALIAEIMRLLRSGKRDQAPAREDRRESERNSTKDEATHQADSSQGSKRQERGAAPGGNRQEDRVRASKGERRTEEPHRASPKPEGGQAPSGGTSPVGPGRESASPPEPPTGAAHGPPRGMFIDPAEAHHVNGEAPESADSRWGDPEAPPPAPPETGIGENPPPEAQGEVEILNFNDRTSIMLQTGDAPLEIPESHEASGIEPFHPQDQVASTTETVLDPDTPDPAPSGEEEEGPIAGPATAEAPGADPRGPKEPREDEPRKNGDPGRDPE